MKAFFLTILFIGLSYLNIAYSYGACGHNEPYQECSERQARERYMEAEAELMKEKAEFLRYCRNNPNSNACINQ